MYKILFSSLCLSLGINAAHAKNIQVNFVVSSNKADVIQYQSSRYFKKQINILNQHFLDENHQKIFNFSLGNSISYNAFTKKNCDFQTMLNKAEVFIVKDLAPSFNHCFPQKKSNQVFVFIYDSYANHNQFSDTTSWGFYNKGKPFILLDWKRFDLDSKSAILHEMGHAMGLNHVCVPGAKRQDATNRMASGQCGKGSMGLRNLGFTAAQVNKMYQNYNAMTQ
ncbi:metalloprotease [Acinetobacter sp.]|uniref:metalloprotease n=1 Tax=Acinetobacter sp. TaxID=472 RepID=UPI00388D4AEE